MGDSGGLLVPLIPAVTIGVVYLGAEKIITSQTNARIANPIAYPNFANAVRDLSVRSGIPMPRLYVMDGFKQPNACAFGNGMFGYSIGITDSIYRMMTPEEMRAVLAHEVAHIKSGDVAIATTAVLVAGTAVFSRKEIR